MVSVVDGNLAPEFSLRDYKGEFFNLSDFNSKSNVLIVLNRGFV